MKKAGSSNSKSKIRPSSKSSAPKTTNKSAGKSTSKAAASEGEISHETAFNELIRSGVLRPESRGPGTDAGARAPLAQAATVTFEAVGHQPAASLRPQDAALFRAFQSNLLSLISHELRTPLMGILNSLGLLEEGVDSPEFSAAELVQMARQNAQRLHRTLSALLDLASLDSGSFHARLREVELRRLASSRLEAHRSLFKDRGLTLEESTDSTSGTGVLADPQKIGRAIDLCLQAILPRAESGTRLGVRVTASSIELSSTLASGKGEGGALWDSAWSQASAGFEGGVGSPTSAFAGVLQSEQAFLSRIEEGLGSEFLLVHEILKLHHGKFASQRKGADVTLRLELPELSSEDGLKAVLASRAYEISTELATVALVLLKIPSNVRGQEGAREFTAEVRRNLFRSSDAVYWLRERGQVALVLDDCKAEDAPRLMERITAKLRKTTLYSGCEFVYGVAQCPSDGVDPAALLPLAQARLESAAA